MRSPAGRRPQRPLGARPKGQWAAAPRERSSSPGDGLHEEVSRMLPTKAKRVAYALAVVSLGTLLLHGLPGGKEPAGASRAARRGPAAVASPPAPPVSDPS